MSVLPVLAGTTSWEAVRRCEEKAWPNANQSDAVAPR